ncbi:MAG: type II toxin-antitoxin system VapC family toxin [Coriobacteriia bacterium]|nr:type II toxin-antitoxin system VapC family toxin [Coriobacteriia bacterium]
MYCLDACILIDFLRGKTPELFRLFRSTDPRLIKIPAVVQGELLVGVQKGNNPALGLRAVEELLLPFEVLPFDSSCAYAYGSIRAQLESAGKKIGANDMMIAATALANHATLVSNNVKDFKRIKGLSLETWEILEL